MKIIEPYYEILTPINGKEALQIIEFCARTCYQSYDKQTDDTVPNVPYSAGGVPQYNPMIVDDRIELMDDVIKDLELYWYSDDPDIEDKTIRVTNRNEELFVGDIYWTLDKPDIVTVVFRLNDRIVEKREIEIDFEDFLGHDIEGSLVKFISKKINSLLDSVLHGGLYKENKDMRELKRSRMNESEQMSHKDIISYIKNLVGNYFYGEDEEGYLIVKCPSGSFRILIADDLGNGIVALEEMVERGVAPMKDEKAIARLLKKHGIIK